MIVSQFAVVNASSFLLIVDRWKFMLWLNNFFKGLTGTNIKKELVSMLRDSSHRMQQLNSRSLDLKWINLNGFCFNLTVEQTRLRSNVMNIPLNEMVTQEKFTKLFWQTIEQE